ncbi:unnamed protein product [Ceratitis capitata]|uniref:(Mediterranean fruit fly) hypothetical protein n=1 Tax=Ceratitis capitata TaxID=7213 RepID=A0A811U6D0_CERCA|nr:unnamed protein product [Ceratitis capitata]
MLPQSLWYTFVVNLFLPILNWWQHVSRHHFCLPSQKATRTTKTQAHQHKAANIASHVNSISISSTDNDNGESASLASANRQEALKNFWSISSSPTARTFLNSLAVYLIYLVMQLTHTVVSTYTHTHTHTTPNKLTNKQALIGVQYVCMHSIVCLRKCFSVCLLAKLTCLLYTHLYLLPLINSLLFSKTSLHKLVLNFIVQQLPMSSQQSS